MPSEKDKILEFKCSQTIQKILQQTYFIFRKRLYEKALRNTQKIKLILKGKNITVNKGRTKITSTSKNLLMIKFIKKFSFSFYRKYRNAAHSINNLRCNMRNEIPVAFHSVSNCDDHFTIK